MRAQIASVSQVVSILRNQLASRVESRPAGKHAAHGKVQVNADGRGAEQLEALISRRVKALDRGDPQRGRKAFRVFLESIFLSSFGEQLINDPEFYQMIDKVQSSMESDPEICRMIDQAIQHLVS